MVNMISSYHLPVGKSTKGIHEYVFSKILKKDVETSSFFYSSALTDHQRGGKRIIQRFPGTGAVNVVQQPRHGLMGHPGDGLGHAAQPGIEIAAHGGIVKPDHADPLRNRNLQPPERVQDLQCIDVISREDGSPLRRLAQPVL